MLPFDSFYPLKSTLIINNGRENRRFYILFTGNNISIKRLFQTSQEILQIHIL